MFSITKREKMKELLQKYNPMLTTPLYQNREWDFESPDDEFKRWGYNGNTIKLWLRDDSGILNLKWDGTKFIGPDPRGGYSTITIPASKTKRFAEELKNPGKINYKQEKQIVKESDVAIVSNIEQDFGDTYPVQQNVKNLVDKLFQTGYNKVYVLDFKAPKNYDQLCSKVIDSQNCHFLMAEGDQDSKSLVEIHKYNKLNNFVIPISTWLRIKGKVMKSNKNLESACQQELKEKDLKAFAFSKSRKKYKVPNDSVLKNFKVV